METAIIALVSSLLGTLVGGLVTFIIQRQQFKHELEILKQTHKTDFMAEDAVMHFLIHEGYTDRSFETIKNHIGGFEDDELRKILVRAGAIRVSRKDGSEWWRLLSRNDEYIRSKRPSAQTLP